MNRRELAGVAGLSAVAIGQETAQGNARERFVGVWRLRGCVRTFADGRKTLPFGERPVGRLQYDREGRMSAMAMHPGRRTTLAAGVELEKASESELREAVAGFTGYFGRFEVDEAGQTVIHRVEASLAPNAVGTELRRRYRFEGNRLTLTRVGAESRDEIVWER